MNLTTRNRSSPRSSRSNNSGFREIVQMIAAGQSRAYQAVNTELIGLYWRVGEYIPELLNLLLDG